MDKARVLLEYLDSSMDEALYAEEEGAAGKLQMIGWVTGFPADT
ncbi:hypothetical protein [Extibacter muris]|nr:hypothetical protein [Extibacter muris]